MTFHAAVRTRLIDAAGVAALAGSRVAWVQRPQGEALEAITLQVISDQREQHLKGFDPIRETRVQIDCWSASHVGAQALAEAVIAALVPEASVGGIAFNRAYVDVVRDLGEQSETQFIHRASIDMRFWWQTS